MVYSLIQGYWRFWEGPSNQVPSQSRLADFANTPSAVQVSRQQHRLAAPAAVPPDLQRKCMNYLIPCVIDTCVLENCFGSEPTLFTKRLSRFKKNVVFCLSLLSDPLKMVLTALLCLSPLLFEGVFEGGLRACPTPSRRTRG